MTDQLTATQRRAVETDSDDVLVIAGAGSGKTRVLSHRVIELMRRGASPSDILVVTFTRKAAGEMAGRISELAQHDGGPSARNRVERGLTIGTFHSVALRWMRAFGDRIGYHPKTMTVLEPDDVELLLELCGRDLGYFDGKWKAGISAKKLLRCLELHYCEGLEGTTEETEQSHKVMQVVQAYQTALRDLNAVDFGAILTKCEELLRIDVVRETLNHRHRHVLVDELQDANAIQHWGFLRHLCRPNGTATFFGVGDPRQTIYGFRGARPDLMQVEHPGAEIINLNECFRCGSSIVTVANDLIAVNNEADCEPMECAVKLRGNAQSGEESVGAALQNYRAMGYAWREMAVLARSHRVLDNVYCELDSRGIPTHRVGQAFDITSTNDFKGLHAVLRLCVNECDNVAFLRFARWIGLSHDELARTRRTAAERHWPLFR